MEEASNTQRTPYLFTAKELDEETGLYYFGARYYDPRTSVWQSADPILDEYLDGEPNGGIYIPATLNLYGYSVHNPVRFKDDTGEWVNFVVGAGVGAVLDITVQAILISTGNQPEGFSGKSVLVSATAGTVGAGLAAKTGQISNLGLKLLAEGAGDAAVSTASKLAKGDKVTAEGVLLDVAAGQAGGKAFGAWTKSKAANSAEAKILDKAADRAERIANNPKVGRPEARSRQAAEAKGSRKTYIDDAEFRAGAAGSGAGQGASEIYQKSRENKNE